MNSEISGARKRIYHIADAATWLQPGELYAPAAFEREGFIHASTRAQVIQTANRIFKGQRDLLLLTIDCEKIHASVINENTEGGTELYPHIYGPLNRDAVISATELSPDEYGLFSFPAF